MGLIVAAALYGFRHGFDFDHLAALADITGSTSDRRRALRLSMLYIAGHALMVMILGSIAVVAGAYIPDALDEAMGRVVGITLVALGLWLAYTAIRHPRRVRLRSRWMLAADGVRKLTGARARREVVVIEHAHNHVHDGLHDHSHPRPSDRGGSIAVAAKTHTHVHKHVATLPADPFESYSAPGAVAIGMAHGVGVETPSQVLLFASAAGASTSAGGLATLAAFVVGLVVANAAIATAATLGFSSAKTPRVYAAVALIAAAFSLLLGTAYLIGRGDAFVLFGF